MTARRLSLGAVSLSVVGLIAAFGVPPARAQMGLVFGSPPSNPDGGRLAGLQWTFVRVKYNPNASPTRYMERMHWPTPPREEPDWWSSPVRR